MKTAAELEVDYARTQKAERVARIVMIVLLVALFVLRVLSRRVADRLRPESWSYVDFAQFYEVVKLALMPTVLLAFVVVGGLRWRLLRLGDAIARAHTLERMTGSRPSSARVLGN